MIKDELFATEVLSDGVEFTFDGDDYLSGED
ncbi:Uncharacterised protein [Sphingobacterium spiritivorum]|uniref:Uncharacterized protein n=1 Tax=Sphingobacterium spiritivorum TaxID=258 RepID=A0A380CXZ1_SPHSI|nr:Uncharacterised protein [Sphingobacterium spiritivorum]SUJ30901.1 Uncharacterised protein [Sphingobacterium spiritivorum]